MEKFQSVLLKVWQEACRHIEIDELTRTVTPFLKKYLPVHQVLIQRINREEGYAETVGIGVPGTGRPPVPGIIHCSEKTLTDIYTWCAEGKAVRADKRGRMPVFLEPLAPRDIQQDIIFGPLTGSDNNRGIMLLIAEQTQAFNDTHIDLVQNFLDPFSIALENDGRIHELAALREAAEADKMSLLRRIGRKELADHIVGAGSGLQLVMERVEQVSHLNVPVLILGETGSGKELIAREIHRRSPRAANTFIRVNCGAIPAELIDSQLFGHERGAFTGAAETRKGWFERADGGTLFLDEIGELPQAAQVRLLRILQDGWLERVGGQKPIHVDVRIVAATHRDLPSEVTQKKFREDLWYRISTFPIRLPSLRERPEDIPDLARHFCERAATRFGLYCVVPTQEQLELLASYRWPGNVRELAAVIDRAAILGNGARLEIATALGIAGLPAASASPDAQPPAAINYSDREFLSLDDAVKNHIAQAITLTRGRIEGHAGAAALLNVHPSTLRAKMRKLHLEPKQFKQS